MLSVRGLGSANNGRYVDFPIFPFGLQNRQTEKVYVLHFYIYMSSFTQISMNMIDTQGFVCKCCIWKNKNKTSRDLVYKSLSFLKFQRRGCDGLSVSKHSALPSAAVNSWPPLMKEYCFLSVCAVTPPIEEPYLIQHT